MTAKAKARMKEIMKEILRKQIGCFTPGKNGWSDHVDSCVAAEICPNCGDDLFFDGEVNGNGLETSFFGCPNCNWEDYNIFAPGHIESASLSVL